MASKSTSIKVGDTVRINEAYGKLWMPNAMRDSEKNQVGVEFIVTKVTRGRDHMGGTFYVSGDPMRRGIWAKYVELVKSRPVKAHTTTRIMARLNYENVEKIVDITSGSKALTLTVKPNPSIYGDATGTTNLTLEQAEQVANDVLERVAEIRRNEAEEAGA